MYFCEHFPPEIEYYNKRKPPQYIIYIVFCYTPYETKNTFSGKRQPFGGCLFLLYLKSDSGIFIGGIYFRNHVRDLPQMVRLSINNFHQIRLRLGQIRHHDCT